jgi:predicted flap endonuclease-1-like 5' DNA nuclease
MDISIIIVITLVAVVVLALIIKAASRPRPVTHTKPAQAVRHEAKHEGITDSAAIAVEDVVGPLVGIDIHPDIPSGPADDLTMLKGLGPKAAAQLHSLGVTRFAQIASWSEADAAVVDARMGAFKGRIFRDKWVEQARYLAKGDRAGFEANFGKLGG